ncbi:MAG TPA: hypothetical protein VEJ63_10125 [Planctomycetota bacterium]|nr:hypothetical protein [Planctomycetota bacterium]
MSEIANLIREYRHIVTQEQQLATRKKLLRDKIMSHMRLQGRKFENCSAGTAICSERTKLVPIRDVMLSVLDKEDLFPFANFSATKVKELLVPKFGRERLIPLFTYERSYALVIKAPTAVQQVVSA